MSALRYRYRVFLCLALLSSACAGDGTTSGVSPTAPSSGNLRIAVPDGRSNVMAPGYTLPLKVMRIAPDGTSEDVTLQAQWSSSNPSGATVSPEGVVSAFMEMSVDVSAAFQGGSALVHLDIRRTCEAATSVLSQTAASVNAFSDFKSVLLSVATTDCRWRTSSDAVWLNGGVASFDPGVSGNGTIGYSYDANTSPAPRIGHVNVVFPTGSNLVLTVTQDKPVCSYVTVPPGATFSSAGGTGEFDLTVTPATCSWVLRTSSFPAGPIQITSPASGTGSTRVSYRLAPVSAPAARTYVLYVGDGIGTSPPNLYPVTLQ
jgi:hypothetical protein